MRFLAYFSPALRVASTYWRENSSSESGTAYLSIRRKIDYPFLERFRKKWIFYRPIIRHETGYRLCAGSTTVDLKSEYDFNLLLFFFQCPWKNTPPIDVYMSWSRNYLAHLVPCLYSSRLRRKFLSLKYRGPLMCESRMRSKFGGRIAEIVRVRKKLTTCIESSTFQPPSACNFVCHAPDRRPRGPFHSVREKLSGGYKLHWRKRGNRNRHR